MWQICPMCKGSGQALTIINNIVSSVCSVCNGQKIINELTGRPPQVPSVTIVSPCYILPETKPCAPSCDASKEYRIDFLTYTNETTE